MQHRPLALALTVAALLGWAGPAAARQPAPAASASPATAESAAPSAEPAAAASQEPVSAASAEPSPAASTEPSPSDASPAPLPAGRSLRGTLVSLKGTVATVRAANGTLQSYTVSAKAAALLKKSLGKKLLYRVVRGTLDLVPH